MTEFKTNGCIGIKVTDLGKAEKFYSDILKLQILSKNENQLVYNTGHLTFFIEKADNFQTPVPSFSVDNFEEAKELLIKSGCEYIQGGKNWLWFKDPFGNVFDIIEE
jgi:catechol 2,3-dioxygenase-like lactoylglutathione lyase family enzyme